ncbi:haloacetate dehalogenase H-2 [Pseudomonas sp. SCT]|mgnify:CR=1 FL=1|uniref:haloacid dehalogenase type II n=1 Tax=Pseudomonas sp. (strain SCT) TaxID=412955 RepID=UPI000EBFC563|nr:haloacid dehalogenase type II [Pseudomonas sp. SCT]GCA58189.1 haloacetate dehalogenase H-2 [Pseudomonas sp. SCT]
MSHAIAFDVYGTLIDTQAVSARLAELIGEKAPAISRAWRQKQLEYSFRRGLMHDYCDFAVCTRQALIFACREAAVDIDEAAVELAMQAYADLDAFPDVRPGLEALRQDGLKLYAFSNGSREAVERLLRRAGILDYFDGVVSVEDVRSFKPDPQVYAHLLRVCDLPASKVYLVSGNPFDILGAAHAGLRTAWLRRDPKAVFDPWEIEPDVTVANFGSIVETISCS